MASMDSSQLHVLEPPAIAAYFGWTESTAKRHMQRLINKNWVRKISFKANTGDKLYRVILSKELVQQYETNMKTPKSSPKQNEEHSND